MQTLKTAEEKEFENPPENWSEWKERWNASQNLVVLLNLIDIGLSLHSGNEEEWYEQHQFYLIIARRFKEKSAENDDPAVKIAWRAFRAIVHHLLKKERYDSKPFVTFVISEILLKEFINLMCSEERSKQQGVWGSYCYAGKYKKILKEFLLDLARFLITLDCSGFISDWHTEEKETLIKTLTPYRSFALSIICAFNEYDLLMELVTPQKASKDPHLPNLIKDEILLQDIIIPPRRERKRTIRTKPKKVSDVLKQKDINWMHDKKIMTLTYLYLGLTTDPWKR